MATTTAMTGAAFDQLPYERGRKWELLHGDLISVPSATPRHQLAVISLGGSLYLYFKRDPRGIVIPDSEFALGGAIRVRPDLAVVLNERWTTIDRQKTPIRVAPNIAIEILLPSESFEESLEKILTYLNAGAREVWQVSLKLQKVLIYRDTKSAIVLGTEDLLSTPLLPGWELAVGDIFAR